MVDASSIFEFTGEKNPNVFNIMSVFLLTFLIADIGFTSFRAGILGALVTSFLFLVSLISGFGFIDNLLFTEDHPLSGNFGYVLGFLGLNIGNIIAGINLSLLSTATQSYLSGILGSEAGILIPIINLVFAPIGESLLIFSFSAGIYSIVKNTGLKDLPFVAQFALVSVPPSLFFAVLHGSRGPSFLLLSFSINMFWTGILFYGDFGRIPSELVPVSLGLIVGLHTGFNVSNFGGVFKFIDTFVQGLGGTYSRSSALILIYNALNLLFAGAYLSDKLGDRI